jgi:hypothetical protein
LDRVRTILLTLGAFGAVAFGAMFITSIVDPGYVEEVGKEIIKQRVEKQG